MLKIPKNPYIHRSMLRNPEAFFGRRREAMRLAARIASDPPQSVAIIGDRRIGKSSLLYYISHPDVVKDYLDEPEQTLFLFLDFQEERRLTIEGFIESVLRHLQEATKERYSFREAPDYEGLQKVVAELNNDGLRLILMLDEFDRVTRSSSFDADFFAFLRSLAGHHNVAYITSTSRDLQQLCHTNEISDSPFFNIFSTIRLGPLTRTEALELVQVPSQNVGIPLEEYTELILDIGGFFPFFLQMACSAVFELLAEEDEAPRKRVCERFMEEARPHFQFYWEQMNAVERALCNDLASGAQTNSDRPEYQELAQRGFILEDGRIFSSLFATFLKEAYTQEVGEVPMEVQAERARSMEGELEKARKMQMDLLPQESPHAAGLDMAGRCEPASHVGGDFYTYLWLDEAQTQLGIVAADVMGHGMEGAVTALRFSETLRYEARGRVQPEDIMSGLNRGLHGTLPSGAFVACCIGVIDLPNNSFRVAAGGYHPPLYYDGTEQRVFEQDLGGLPLGIRPDTTYQSHQFSLKQGDMLLFFSDGVIEAQDDREVLYGEDRLEDLLLNGGKEDLSATQLLERLFWDVGRFSASVGQTDDITAIAVRIIGDH